MRYALTPAQRKQKTYHSKRVWVATGLRSRNRSDGEIQAWVRWSSEASLLIYARRSHAEQAAARDDLIHADVDTINASVMPQYDYSTDDVQRLEMLAAAFEEA